MSTIWCVKNTGNETITLDDTAEEEEETETERRRREESSSPCSVIEIIGPPTAAHSRRQQESNIQDIASRYCPPVACPDYIPLRTGYSSGLPVSSVNNRGRAAYADVAARGNRGRTLAPRRGLAADGRGAAKGRGGRPGGSTLRLNGPPPRFSASRGLNLQFGGGGVPPPPPGEVFRFTGSNQTAASAAANTRPTIDATVFSGRDKENHMS